MTKEHTENQKDCMEVVKPFLLKFLSVRALIKDIINMAERDH